VTRESGPKAAPKIPPARTIEANDSSAVLVDLDSLTAEDLDHLRAIKRREEQAERDRLDQELAERAELRDNWREVIPDRPALGAFPRRDRVVAPTGDELIVDDPHRLANVVVEMLRFTTDEAKVISAAALYAANLGIEDPVAESAIAEGLIRARLARRGRHAG
jgi:hypothetical protein